MLYFPEDWHPRLRTVVRVAERRLTEREREFPYANPEHLLQRAVRQAILRLREVLPGVEYEVPDSWWFRWEAGYLPEEIAAILCGEAPEIVRPNGAKDKYVRRVPTGYAPPKKKYRYLYDPRKVTDTSARPLVGEKIKVQHGDQPGHYEVIKTLPNGSVVVVHDESGHTMAINPIRLYDMGMTANYEEFRKAQEAERLRKFKRKDRLPKSKDDVLQMLLDASDVSDHDFSKADAAYREWKRRGRRKAEKPKLWPGGELDVFQGDHKKYCCLLEAFEDHTRDAKTWQDIIPVLDKLNAMKAFGGKKIRLPREILDLHTEDKISKKLFDQDMDDAPKRSKVDPKKYGTTIEGASDEASKAAEEEDIVDETVEMPGGDTSFDFGANVDQAFDDFLQDEFGY